MVKVGILDADKPLAGELIRILINHPETELVSLFAPSLIGRNVAAYHHGLVGETQLNFTDKINPEELDLIIIMESSEVGNKILSQLPELENLKVISLSRKPIDDLKIQDAEIGLSEINRKSLVRGARLAYIPSPLESPVLIALNPLANFLLLNSDIEIDVKLPEDLYQSYNSEIIEDNLSNQLRLSQASFSGNIKINVHPEKALQRGQITDIRLTNSLPVEELEKIYEQTYDDHNFSFLSSFEVGVEDIEATQKAIINIKKPETNVLEIKVVTDSRMRGGAGDIVHVLNLFFGLYEKTGLRLKTSAFKKINI